MTTINQDKVGVPEGNGSMESDRANKRQKISAGAACIPGFGEAATASMPPSTPDVVAHPTISSNGKQDTNVLVQDSLPPKLDKDTGAKPSNTTTSAPKPMAVDEAPSKGRVATSEGNGAAEKISQTITATTRSNDTKERNSSNNVEVVTKHVKLQELPRRVPAPPKLNASEKLELEIALQLDPNDAEEWWRDDWSGNLAFMSKEVSNPATKRKKPQKTEITQTLWEWAQTPNSVLARKLGCNLLSLVYHQAPPMAKRILGHASTQWESKALNFDVLEDIKRCSYDPAVLQEDGWTTSPYAKMEETASGGPTNIGKKVFWQGYEAVIIAYVHDNDFGDLWKAMWLDAFETFDLEAEELQQAVRKWERRNKKAEAKKNPKAEAAASARFASVKDMSVEGIEHGIVLATTYNPNARQGVFWPARILHVSELDKSSSQSKRNSAKQRINVMFLAPYWNSNGTSGRAANYSSYPLFQVETIEVSYDAIQRYPHDGHRGLNIHQLRVAFRFTGLPKNAFGRFLDSHRLAMSLKLYAQEELTATTIKSQHASAALFDTHPLAVNTAHFPTAILHLPFQYIISKLKAPDKQKAVANDEASTIEPTLQLAYILKSMEPPRCFGKGPEAKAPANGSLSETSTSKDALALMASPNSKGLLARVDSSKNVVSPDDKITARSLLSEFLAQELDKLSQTDLPSASLLQDLEKLVGRAVRIVQSITGDNQVDEATKNLKLKSILQECLRMKSYGEDVLAADGSLLGKHSKPTLTEWNKSCERLFKFVTIRCSASGFGNGVTVVISDSRCNEHITKNGCVERPVRLPTALKAAKMAGAGSTPSFPFKNGVDDHYMKLATDKFLEKAHTVAYLKKIKAKCTAIAPDASGAQLTEASDGEGGCDTTGSRGTWDAAVAGTAAAMKAVDLIVGGQCVNAFCATRPPGHHAGRELHPMGAISNGFCVLNPVAVAAIYATTPPSEGGLGLKRAVVIDFDVHHGNGTQDILCSTYDPRFLYVSMHAGGALINGYETDDSDMDFPNYGSKGGKKQEGIFPGRCGDSSPHKGVINLPLGARVTPQDVGNALVTVIEPAVEDFSPDIIILSAGFDGHKNDPLGMGGLSAHDFGHITEVACGMAFRFCSGRIMSVLEGGYGVPCCRPQNDLFLPAPKPILPPQESTESAPPSNQPDESQKTAQETSDPATTEMVKVSRAQPSKLLDLGESLPDAMDDQVTPGMQRKLEKCHGEGFLDCVREHVSSLKKNNLRS